MAQPHTRSPVVGGKTNWGIATGTGHLEPDRYPPANGTQREGNCRMYSCQSERYGATSFIALGSLARATRASAGGSPRHFRSHFLAPNIGASIRCCCSALLRNSRSRRTGPRSSSASAHALRSWHSKLRHSVQHSALDRGFDFLVLDRSGREAYPEYRLVP